MRIVFLDVDGPLTYSEYENEETAGIDPEKVKLLKEICDKTDAKVVIISSWRGGRDYTPRIYHVLIDVLTKYGVEVIGDAPYIDSVIEGEVPNPCTFEDIAKIKIKHGTGRAAEVQQWLNEHPDTESFVILDDEDFGWADYGYEKHWVRPTWFGNGGLKQVHVDNAIKILYNNIS